MNKIPLFSLLFLSTSYARINEFKPLLHTWSIAIEEQYYVGFPIILLFMWRFGRKWLLGAVVSIISDSIILNAGLV